MIGAINKFAEIFDLLQDRQKFIAQIEKDIAEFERLARDSDDKDPVLVLESMCAVTQRLSSRLQSLVRKIKGA